MLKISLVTPSYNQGVFLTSTIKSVIDQNYPDLEYLVIDGGSSDNSVDIIKRYEKSLTYWISERDHGQCEAINKGWRRVTGEIIGYLNSDDLLLPGSLNRVSSFFENNPHVDFIYGNAIYIDKDGKTIGRLNGQPFDLRRLLLRIQTIPQPAMFFRRKLLDEIGYLDENLHYTMDFDFWLKIAKIYTIEYVPQDLAAMRLHTDAKTTSQQDLFYKDELIVLTRFFSQPGLSVSLKNAEPLAFARCYFRGAEALFRMGSFSESRDLIVRAIRLSPKVLLEDRNAILCFSHAVKSDLEPGYREKKNRIKGLFKRNRNPGE